MATERLYGEDEVRAIFEAATEAQDASRTSLPSSDGLSLTELQEIGREVGLAPDRIAEAASALEVRRSAPPTRTYLGLPLSVARTAELPRAPTDREWELLVAEIRATFDAPGEISSHGSLRQWTNGNLQVSVEPTSSGHRLRMRTLKGSVLPMTIMGLSGVGMGLFLTIALATRERLADEFLLPIFFAAMGIGAIVAGMARLPGWARERREQMEYIAARAQALLSAGEDEG